MEYYPGLIEYGILLLLGKKWRSFLLDCKRSSLPSSTDRKMEYYQIPSLLNSKSINSNRVLSLFDIRQNIIPYQ